jgi:hypothetical protein
MRDLSVTPLALYRGANADSAAVISSAGAVHRASMEVVRRSATASAVTSMLNLASRRVCCLNVAMVLSSSGWTPSSSAYM